MHEMSLVRALMKQVHEILDDHHATEAKRVTVELGPLSGVEAALLETAFRQHATGTRDEITELVIEEVPLVVRCLHCQSETELCDFDFRCNECDSRRVRVIRGDEFRLLSITIDASQDTSTSQEESHV